MAKDLTSSPVDRQNILNNPYALAEIEKAAGLQGIPPLRPLRPLFAPLAL